MPVCRSPSMLVLVRRGFVFAMRPCVVMSSVSVHQTTPCRNCIPGLGIVLCRYRGSLSERYSANCWRSPWCLPVFSGSDCLLVWDVSSACLVGIGLCLLYSTASPVVATSYLLLSCSPLQHTYKTALSSLAHAPFN